MSELFFLKKKKKKGRESHCPGLPTGRSAGGSRSHRPRGGLHSNRYREFDMLVNLQDQRSMKGRQVAPSGVITR